MPEQIVDGDGEISFVDGDGETHFIDGNGDFIQANTGHTITIRYVHEARTSA